MSERWDDPNRQAVGLDPVGASGGQAQPAAQSRSETSLDDMTKDELLEHARSIGAKPANAAMSKEELRQSIDEAG